MFVDKSEGVDKLWKPPVSAHDSVHAAMISLVEWFIRNIPFSFELAIEHHAELVSRPLDNILIDLLRMKCGCMCGGMSVLMARLAKREGYDAIELNFGDPNASDSEAMEAIASDSHVAVLVDIGHSERVIYDPTFGYFSGSMDGTPVSIRTIIELLRRNRCSELRWIKISPREKPFLFDKNVKRVPLYSSINMVDKHTNLAIIDLDLFAEMSLGALGRWVNAQNPQYKFPFDCLRFPISTSGEAEAELIASQLLDLQ